jgi:hypothetical protein
MYDDLFCSWGEDRVDETTSNQPDEEVNPWIVLNDFFTKFALNNNFLNVINPWHIFHNYFDMQGVMRAR